MKPHLLLFLWLFSLALAPMASAQYHVLSHHKISDVDYGDAFTALLDADDHFGASVAAIGDLDGDGVEDLAIGAPGDDDEHSNAGAVWILFMNDDGTVRSHHKISDSTTNFGTHLTGLDAFGSSVASLGDLDGDGVNDLAVGATKDNGPFQDGGGVVWILFMNTDGTVHGYQKIEESDLGGGQIDNGDDFGTAVAALGDPDGDGLTLLAVGAPGDDDGGSAHGAVWLLSLDAAGAVQSYQKIADCDPDLDPACIPFGGTLSSQDRLGSSLAVLGDYDGNGTPDLAIGVPGDDGNHSGEGAAWLLFLNADQTIGSQHKIAEGIGGFTGPLSGGDGFGSALAFLGDRDGDGVSELAVGAVGDSGHMGAIWVLNLNTAGAVIGEAKIPGDGGFIGNLDDDDYFGVSVAAAGDLNRGGTVDLVVGAYFDDDDGNLDDGVHVNLGAAWVLFPDESHELRVTSPNGGETWTPGTTETVTWDDDLTEDFRIELLKGGALARTLTFSIPGGTGAFPYPVPMDIEPGTDYRVRVRYNDDLGLYDVSDNDFEIGAGIVVTAPVGGTEWPVCTEQTITWETNVPGEDVQILLIGGGAEYKLVHRTANDGSFTYDIPSDFDPGDDYTVRVHLFDDHSVGGESGPFSITPASITITNPLAGFIWTPGEDTTIKWEDNLDGEVSIKLYSERGGYLSTIASSTPSDGTYTYAVPPRLAPGDDYFLRIRSVEHAEVVAESGRFTVERSIIMTNPPADEGEGNGAALPVVWTAGTRQDVTWTTNVPDEMVDVQLWKAGAYHALIANDVSNDEHVFFNIPSGLEPGTDYSIRVRVHDDASVRGDSELFQIKAGAMITLTSPNDKDVYSTCDLLPILWSDNFDPNVRIMLFRDGSFFRMIVGSTESDGAYAWPIPDNLPPATTYSMRIRQADNHLVRDDSDGTFEIEDGRPCFNAPELIGERAAAKAEAMTAEDADGRLRWKPVEGAEGYRVEVAADETFATILHTVTLDASTTTFDVSAALGEEGRGLFAVRVRAEAGGGHSAWAETTLAADTPETFVLDGNYPNPFNPTTTIRYALKEATAVRLAVYDVLGREVAVLVDGPQVAGAHQVRFEATGLPSGVYFYRIAAGAFEAVEPMMLAK